MIARISAGLATILGVLAWEPGSFGLHRLSSWGREAQVVEPEKDCAPAAAILDLCSHPQDGRYLCTLQIAESALEGALLAEVRSNVDVVVADYYEQSARPLADRGLRRSRHLLRKDVLRVLGSGRYDYASSEECIVRWPAYSQVTNGLIGSASPPCATWRYKSSTGAEAVETRGPDSEGRVVYARELVQDPRWQVSGGLLMQAKFGFTIGKVLRAMLDCGLIIRTTAPEEDRIFGRIDPTIPVGARAYDQITEQIRSNQGSEPWCAVLDLRLPIQLRARHSESVTEVTVVWLDPLRERPVLALDATFRGGRLSGLQEFRYALGTEVLLGSRVMHVEQCDPQSSLLELRWTPQRGDWVEDMRFGKSMVTYRVKADGVLPEDSEIRARAEQAEED